MKARSVLTSVWLVALLLTAPGTLPAEVEGEPLDFRATTTAGDPADARTLAGRWVLLDFWGTWCVPCVAAFPVLQRLQDEHPDDLTVVGLAFYSGEGSSVAAFAAEHDVRYTVWMGDDEIISKFGVIAFPSYFLIDPEGEVLLAIVGESADLYGEASALLPSVGEVGGS
ncbi:MAG: TlpA disulfide reductase family protein [Thermoanaerobaculia bacterium]